METSQVIQIKSIPEDLQNIKPFYEMDNFQVKVRDDYEIASQYFLQIASRLKIVEAERTKIVKPLNEGVKSVNSLFKRISDPLNKIKDNLQRKMVVFADGERKKLEDEEREKKAQQKSEFEARSKEAASEAISTESEAALETANNFQKQADKIDLANIEVKQTVRLGSVGTMAERRVWKWQIVDYAAIPKIYMIVDEKKLNSLARSYCAGKQEIPGIKFYLETSFSATTR